MHEEEMTPEQELKNIQAQGRLIADFYTGRLNQAGRDYLNTVLAALNQPAYLQDASSIPVAQQVPADVRQTVVAVEGVRELEELDRRTKTVFYIEPKWLMCEKEKAVDLQQIDAWRDWLHNAWNARSA